MAYEKIYGVPYTPEIKFTNEGKKADADALCANCPHNAKCYKSGDWFPCADYLKLAGTEKTAQFFEYDDNVNQDTTGKRTAKKKTSDNQ